jgi:hypothetical protein
MWGRLAAIALSITFPSGTARAVAQPPSLAAARSAQRDFERLRRQRLPVALGSGAGPCEVRIGRFCYWNNNGEQPPAEPERIARARATLLDRLAAAVRGDSTDDWIVGQLVRYYAESRRFDEGAAAATRCGGTAWWCAALRGLALHYRGDHAASTAAFDSALALQPTDERCRWTDLRPWLGDALARDFKRQPCGAAREAWSRRFWPAARPLLMLPGNDLRDELLSRHAMARIQSRGAIPYDVSWGADMTELEVRYGWPTAWSAYAPGSAMSNERSVVGHEPTPSFAFVPASAAPLNVPGSAPPDAWSLAAPLAEMRYAPRYAPNGFVTLPHQLARFRRGDSTLVVGAWDVSHDSAWTRDTSTMVRDTATTDTLRAGLIVVDTSGAERRALRDTATARGVIALTVPAGAYLASLELFAPHRGRAARARYGLPPLASDALASDLLLLAHGVRADASLDPSLDAVLGDALGTRTIAAGSPVGLYWETYFPVETGAADTSATAPEVTVRATRIDAAWYERLGRALRLDGVLGGSPQTPIAVRFTDASRRSHAWAARTLSLTWPPTATGTYRLDVSVRVGDRTATTSEVVRVR